VGSGEFAAGYDSSNDMIRKSLDSIQQTEEIVKRLKKLYQNGFVRLNYMVAQSSKEKINCGFIHFIKLEGEKATFNPLFKEFVQLCNNVKQNDK
jgi:hypothetical protein